MFDQPWRPSRLTTVLIGGLTVLPMIHMCLFVAFMVYSFTSTSSHAENDAGIATLFRYIFTSHILAMLLIVILITTYIVHVFRTNLIPNDMKVLWAVVLFFGSIIAMPIYWYLYMWRPSGAASRGEPGSR